MIRDVVLPQLSMGMSEGTITAWAVQEGARIQRDALLASIETEKVVNDLPAPYGGFVHILVPAGKTVPIETPIARIAESEQEYAQLLLPAADAGGPIAARADQPVTGPVTSAAPAARRIRISGLARKLAGEHGIDPATLRGSGPDGRIEREDVLAVLAERTARQGGGADATGAGMPQQRSEKARVPMRGMRKRIAEHLVASKTTAAGVYLFAEMDVTALIAAREAWLARAPESGTRISMTALLVKALASALEEVPICNATLIGEEIVLWEDVNVAIAVALPGKGDYDSGLITPVVREVNRKDVLTIDRDIKDLVARARSGTLRPEDTTGGTVNLSSTDGFFPGGWLVGTPLLNLPMVVSFGPGTAIQKPVVIDGQIAVRTILPCGLTFDHRALDGAPAAQLLRAIADRFAHPDCIGVSTHEHS
ncbi:MAG: 2-oxo acid dehydrogenase subunit E2 [Gammaproteobacteria bacterium]|nr:2-oxo acid dehydrogenase subunit E2 [Gammaproteobacteria bacterium]